MIALEERRCDPNGLAAELERIGGRLMMLFVTPGAEGAHELCAIVRADEAVLRLRVSLGGNSYPAEIGRAHV